MSDEEEKRCPLCAEEMDWTDQQLKPCKCGYQVCVWCWHHIMDMADKDETEGRCPACRSPYDKEKIVGMEANFERVTLNRKQKPPKPKPKTSEGRKDLTNVRVIQRKMAYVIGLPLSIADEDLLQRKEYFGQYGRVSKVSLSRTAGGAIQQFVNDSCSVYITYSKEEEAIRCIQSVHGFVLEGRFLRASFGTAKYCHAWLRNMPCNNPSCLYLHSVGAEEDSFGKDEIAAVHTRSRVQQIVGATHNLHRRSGSVLPLPVDEPSNSSATSLDKSFIISTMKDAVHTSVTSSGQLTSLLSSEDNDGGSRNPNRTTTFVDIVGRPSSSGTEKSGSVSEDRRMLNCSELSPVTIDNDYHIEADSSDAMISRVSSSSHLVNGFHGNKEFNEPFREPANLLLGRSDATPSDISLSNEHSSLMKDCGRHVLHGAGSVVREDVLSFDDKKLKNSDSLSQTASLFSSSFPTKLAAEDSIDIAWQEREPCCLSDSKDHDSVYNHMEEDAIQLKCVNSVLDDGYNERKFRSSAKSDRIYRCSNSFSNEEIVEQLRRLDNDNTNDDENSALAAVESSIISNILSMDFDDDSLNFSDVSAGLFEENNRSWNSHITDQSRFSFVEQDGFASNVIDMDSSFGKIGLVSKKCSMLQDVRETKEQYLHNPPPQYHASRAHSLTPQGFSVTTRDPPPGFSTANRTNQVHGASSGNHFVKSSLTSNNPYRTSSAVSIGNTTSDVEFNDPAILVVGRGKPTHGLNNSGLDMRPAYSSQSNAFEDEARLWFLMQQSANAHHEDPKFSQLYMHQQAPSPHQESGYSAHFGDGFSSHLDGYYGISSRMMDQQQTYNNPSSFAQLSEQKYSNGLVSNGFQPGLDEIQRRNETGMAGIQRNERLGLNRFYPSHGDLMFQMPNSGDVYTSRVFGM